MNSSSPFGRTISSADILATMQQLHGWEDRYRQLIMWGKQLPAMATELKTDDVLVSGCESEVWIVCRCEQKLWHFDVDSDARIVRGLLALVMAAVEGKSSAEIQAFNMADYFEQLGLLNHLSPSRGNGLLAIVETIRRVTA